MAKKMTIAPANPWVDIGWNNTVASCDASIITPNFCKSNGISIYDLPEPYTGNPYSKVVLLNLNPGLNNCESGFYKNGLYLQKRTETLLHKTKEFMWLNDIICNSGGLHPGCLWWRQKTKELQEELVNMGKLNKNSPQYLGIFAIEYFPYHSRHAFNFPKLPSDNYRNHLLAQAIAQDKLIIIMRSKNKWYNIPKVGQMLKDHKAKGRIIELCSPQNVCITKNNVDTNRSSFPNWNLLLNEF